MKIVALIVGVVVALLGGLWLLQGLGLVHLEPVACVTACETLEGPSLMWTAIGFAVLTVGLLAIFYGLKRWGRH
jgi:ABC-type transport system involved in cytochrome c biogenesis permease subunit